MHLLLDHLPCSLHNAQYRADTVLSIDGVCVILNAFVCVAPLEDTTITAVSQWSLTAVKSFSYTPSIYLIL